MSINITDTVQKLPQDTSLDMELRSSDAPDPPLSSVIARALFPLTVSTSVLFFCSWQHCSQLVCMRELSGDLRPQTAAPLVEMPFSRLACVTSAAGYLERALSGTSVRVQLEQASSSEFG